MRLINLNVSCKLHPYSLQRKPPPPGPRLPRMIGNTHLRNYYNPKGKDIDVYFLFLSKRIVVSVVEFRLWILLSLVRYPLGGIAMLMWPNKVETAVHCFCLSRASVCRIFWSLSFNSQYNSSIKKKKSTPIFTNPSGRAGHDTKSIFKQNLTGLNSGFSFSYTSCLTKAEEPSLPHYLPIAGTRTIGFIPFPRVLVLCEMQPVLSRIWTRVAVSIFQTECICMLYNFSDVHFFGGVRGVMVIVAENGHGDTSSNSGQDWLHFT